MKTIIITGKRNIDKIQKIDNPIRKDSMKLGLDDIYYTYNKHIEIINRMYLEETQEYEAILKREISKKISGYRNQDIQKKLIDLIQFISLDQTIELLLVSKLKCFYCNDKCELLYKSIFAKKQWTLDRIDNNRGHNHDNVVICCLDCNVKRGNMDSDRFKRGKEIKIVKKQF